VTHQDTAARVEGDRRPDAVRVYERECHSRIPLFPPDERLSYSYCFEKVLGPAPRAASGGLSPDHPSPEREP
jgi:hypothetical protein